MSSTEKTPDPAAALEEVYSAFCDAWLDGEEPDLEAFCREHPSIEKQLRERIERFMTTVKQLKQDCTTRVRELSGLSGEAAAGSPGPDEEQLGDFVLIRELGRGGMGVVYEARQVSLNRTVALKVLPAHLTLRKESVERFRREASSGAKIKHPGIVEIHAVGEDRGNHFFAMELIEGAPLDRVIGELRAGGVHRVDGKRMGEIVAAGRFRLTCEADKAEKPAVIEGSHWDKGYVEVVCRIMMQLLEAIDHAHKTGVIHRDVKPSNILIRCDGSAVLTDFGLAREKGLPSLTLTGELAGTPHYLSPEQASPKRKDLDHRVDIFALGATLYELITLQKAYDGKTSQEVITKILNKEPTLPRSIVRTIPRDLETICLKAMEKDPDRRYATAGEILQDLKNFLEFRPIKAQPVGMVTRSIRLVRRNPALSAMYGMLFLLVVVGPTVFGIQQKLFSSKVQKALTKAEDERKAAEKERRAKEKALRRAKKELDLSNAVTQFLVSLFQKSGPNQTLGKNITAYELLKLGAASTYSEFKDQPELRVQLITIMAQAFIAFGDFKIAETLLKDALNTSEISLGGNHDLSMPILNQLADMYFIMDRFDESEVMINRVLAATSGCVNKKETTWHLMALNALASLRLKQGRREEAEILLRDILKKSEKTLGRKNTITIESMICLGQVCCERNKLDEAETLLLDCLDLCMETCGEDDHRTDIASSSLGSLYLQMQKYEKSEPHLVRVSERCRRVYGAMAPPTQVANIKLASLYLETERIQEAEVLLLDAVNSLGEKLGAHHSSTLNSILVLAKLYMESGRSPEAILLANKTLVEIPEDVPELAWARQKLNEIIWFCNQKK